MTGAGRLESCKGCSAHLQIEVWLHQRSIVWLSRAQQRHLLVQAVHAVQSAKEDHGSSLFLELLGNTLDYIYLATGNVWWFGASWGNHRLSEASTDLCCQYCSLLECRTIGRSSVVSANNLGWY